MCVQDAILSNKETYSPIDLVLLLYLLIVLCISEFADLDTSLFHFLQERLTKKKHRKKRSLN